MHWFESPYVIISLFVVSFIVLVTLGILFVVRGIKLAAGTQGGMVAIGRMERDFKKMGKQRLLRCVVYVGVSSEDSHRVSPTLYHEIQQLLLACFSEDGVVSPYTESHFVVLTDENAETTREQIEALVTQLNEQLVKHGVLNVVSVRIGFCFAASDVTFDEAITRSKQACTIAKEQKIPYAEWDLNSGKALEKKIEIENNIERQIDNNRFFLEYQPVLDAKTKTIIGAEVLSRLNSENDGILNPGTFLPALDSVGINEKFDYYIFEKNCKWISHDKEQREGLKYTINFSRSTLTEPTFAKTILDIAEKYELKLSCLAVEVLEDKNVTEAEKEQMNKNLATLKDSGVSILLDDFGSGYAAIGDLQDLDISIVKIDKEMTWKAVTDKGFAILENIIRIAHEIGLSVLCEGVETKEQEDAVLRAGCDFLQGFYYYKPMPVSMLEKLFDKN